MKIDIYQSEINSKKFLSIAYGKDIHDINIKETDPDYQRVSLFKSDIEINTGDSRIAIDSDEAIKAIKSNGYYLHGATITLTP